VLGIDDGAYSSKESPEAAWPKFLSTFIYAAFTSVGKRDSHYDDIAVVAVFDYGAHSQVIRIHITYVPIINYTSHHPLQASNHHD
jgi:hypothetical protein